MSFHLFHYTGKHHFYFHKKAPRKEARIRVIFDKIINI